MNKGFVTAISQYGFKTGAAKDAPWHNWANGYADRPELKKGDRIEFDSNEKGYVDRLRIVDGGESGGAPQEERVAPSRSRSEPDLRDTLIVRQVAVKAAIEMLAHHEAWIGVGAVEKAQGVTRIAAYFEAYILAFDDPDTEEENQPWE